MKTIVLGLFAASMAVDFKTVEATRLNNRIHHKLNQLEAARNDKAKSMSERAAGDSFDTHVSKSILEEAAQEIENSQDEDFEFLPDGSMRVHVKGEDDSETSNKGHNMVQAKAKADPAPAAPAAPAAQAAPAKAPVPSQVIDPSKSVNQYANWWETPVNSKAPTKDDTPEEIREHPDYKKLVDRFLPEFFADNNLNKHLAGKPQIDHDEIKETKEREGMYPNELDQEMQGYTYGDKLVPRWFPYVASSNYWDYWSHQGTFAPPFNPSGLYESPYYDYGDRLGWANWTTSGQGFWNFDKWSNFLAQQPNAKELSKLITNQQQFINFVQSHPPPGFVANNAS